MSMRHLTDTETHCHCGAAYNGSDHCPSCCCEQYEGGCDFRDPASQAAEEVRQTVADARFWAVTDAVGGEFRFERDGRSFTVTVAER